jgi:hypothetical protein
MCARLLEHDRGEAFHSGPPRFPNLDATEADSPERYRDIGNRENQTQPSLQAIPDVDTQPVRPAERGPIDDAFSHFRREPARRAQEFLPESQVKAAYLFNFLKFVEWPGNPVVDGQGKWVIGIVGDSPVGGELARLAERKSALNRDLQVKKLRATDDLRACNILFISESERKRLPLIFAALRGSSVMTVADMHHFIESGGMVQLVVEDARVRLTIDVGATDRARLKVSSKLMALTLAVTADVRNRK